MALKKYSDNAISSLNDDWGNDPKDGNLPFSGKAVQDFIKSQLGEKVGYASTELDTTLDKTFIYFFQSQATYEEWVADKVGHADNIKFSCELPTGGGSQTLDVYSVSLEKPDDQDLEIITTNSNVYLKIRANSKVKRGGSNETVQLKETGTLTISTAAGTSNAFTKRRSMSLSSIDNEEDTNNYTTIDVSDYITKDATVKIRLAWKGSESQLTRTITFIVDQSTFGLSFATEYEYPFKSNTDTILNFATTGSIAKTLYVRINGFKTNEDHLSIGDQIYTHKSSGPLTGNVTEAINIGKVSNGIYNGTYWICTDSIKSEEKAFQFIVSDEDSGMQLVVNNINNSISNWALNDIFDYAFCGAPTSNLKFIFWSTDLTKTYAEVSESSVTPKAKHTLKLQTEFDVDSDIKNLPVTVRVYEDKGTTITNVTPPVSEVSITVDTTENFAPTSMASGFILDPKSRSNAGSDRETIYNALDNTVVTNSPDAWVDMDWLNGGWTSDEGGNKCLRMLAGSKVTIPFKVFDASEGRNTLRYGVTIEVDCAFRNVSNDTEPVVNMSTKLTRTQPYGMIMYPNAAYIYTNSLIDTLNQDTEYQEDTRIHFTTNIKYGHTLTVNGRNYSGNIIRTYINGTVNREFMYESSDSFHVDTDNIVIGSDYADVDIYGIRIYENQTLDTVQIQNDYVSALPSFADKKAYKAANAICNNDGTINYDLAKNKYRTIKFTGRYPYYMNQSSSEGTLTVTYLLDTLDEYGNYEVDTDNSCIITNMSCKGQGSTSKQYYKWNGSWSFKDSSVYKDINGNVIDNHAYFQVVKRDEDDNIVAVTPRATKLVGKLNYASSMQSHKQGSLNMYEDLRERFGFKTEIQNIGGSDDPGDQYYEKRFDLSRLALREDEFLFFVEEDGETRFYGLMTWGAAKGDKLTYGYDKKTEGSKDMLMVGGSTQTNPLTLCHAPWITDEVSVSTDDEGSIETWTYNGSNAYDNELGNTRSIIYLRDYMNFIYECSYRLKYYDGSAQSMNENLTSVDDRTYQYWTQDFEVHRYDYINNEWVSAGVHIYNDDPSDYTKSTTAKTSLNLITSLNGITVVAPDGREVTVNASIKDLGYSNEDLNTIFKRARAKKLRNNISNYVNPNEVLFCFAFTLFIAASDNLAKNSYFMVDKKASGATRPKIHPWRDDDDTIFRINNEGTKDKNYWVEFFTKKENGNPYFTANNTAYYGTLIYAYLIDLEERDATSTPSLRSIMNTMIGHMASLGSGYEINDDPVLGCFNRYYFSIQKYFPSVAYNETARLLYEEAELRMKAGEEVLDPSKNDRPITMSMGDSLQGEIQFMKMRTFFMKTFAMYYNGLSKFGYKLDDQKTLGDDLNVTVEAGAHMYVFSMNTEKSTKQNHPILKNPGETHTFKLDAGQTVTASVVGTEYLSSVGDWSNKKTYDGKSSINLISNRTNKFKGGDAVAENVLFDANTIGSFPSIIEEIDLRNVKNLQGSGNFTRYTRLKKLLLGGTNLNTIELPMTNSLTEVTIPSVIEAITIRQAPNFDDHSLMLEEKDHLKTITVYSDGETGYYGTNFEWVRKWLDYLSSEVNKAIECKLIMEGIKWTLTNDQCIELANIRTEINNLDIKGTIICDPDTFTSDTINIIKAAFGDDAFNPSNPLRFVVAIPYSEILYASTSNDKVTNGSLKQETNNGIDVIQGWSNNYTLYTINYDIIKVTWSVTQNVNLTLSNQTDEGVTVTCDSVLDSDKHAILTASIEVRNDDGSIRTVNVTKNLEVKLRTYPVESDCNISDNGVLTEYHKEYDYNLTFEKPYYTGNYEITWDMGDLNGDSFVVNPTVARITKTSNGGKTCTVYTEDNSDQAIKTMLRLLIKCGDGSTVVKYKPIFVGKNLMGQFGDVYLSTGEFVRPAYTYDENGIVSSVVVPLKSGDIPIGVTIVPRNHTEDGTARVMSLAEMSTATPNTGAFTHEGINWGGYQQDITDLPNLTKVPIISNSASTNDWSRLGSETNYNGNFRYHNSGETGDGLWYYSTSADTFSEGWNRACPSPFKGTSPFEPDAELNPLYAKEGTATADYDGKGNTEKILAHMADESWKTSETIHKTSSNVAEDSKNYHPAAACCWRYSTPGTTQGQWYLPACGELGYIIPRMNTLNKILNAIPNANGGTSKALSLSTNNYYWSSSEYSSYTARHVYTGNGNVTNHSKYNYFYVRAVLAV